MTDLKEKGVTVSLSTVATLIPVLAFVWFIVQPVLLNNISTAMADDIQKKIDQEQKPIEAAFKVLLLADINKLKKSIALLEWRRDNESETWLEEHAALLAERNIELAALEAAYAEL